MKRLTLSLALIALTASPAAAQVASSGLPPSPGGSGTEVLGSPGDVGIVATTPSRIASSRREMNRGRSTPFAARMSARQTRVYADELLERAQIVCDVDDAKVVAHTPDHLPVVEVDCAAGGGLLIVDSDPFQATDCLDLQPLDGAAVQDGALLACQLPGNVASVNAARQSARN